MPMQNIIDSVRVISNECQVDWEGSTLAGGLVDHSDYWSVDVEWDPKCEGLGA